MMLSPRSIVTCTKWESGSEINDLPKFSIGKYMHESTKPIKISLTPLLISWFPQVLKHLICNTTQSRVFLSRRMHDAVQNEQNSSLWNWSENSWRGWKGQLNFETNDQGLCCFCSKWISRNLEKMRQMTSLLHKMSFQSNYKYNMKNEFALHDTHNELDGRWRICHVDLKTISMRHATHIEKSLHNLGAISKSIRFHLMLIQTAFKRKKRRAD